MVTLVQPSAIPSEAQDHIFLNQAIAESQIPLINVVTLVQPSAIPSLAHAQSPLNQAIAESHTPLTNVVTLVQPLAIPSLAHSQRPLNQPITLSHTPWINSVKPVHTPDIASLAHVQSPLNQSTTFRKASLIGFQNLTVSQRTNPAMAATTRIFHFANIITTLKIVLKKLKNFKIILPNLPIPPNFSAIPPSTASSPSFDASGPSATSAIISRSDVCFFSSSNISAELPAILSIAIAGSAIPAPSAAASLPSASTPSSSSPPPNIDIAAPLREAPIPLIFPPIVVGFSCGLTSSTGLPVSGSVPNAAPFPIT